MARVLVFIDWYSPAFKAGGPIRSVRNLLEATSNEHEYYVLAGARDFGEQENLPGVALNEWQDKGSAQVMYLTPDKLTKAFYREVEQNIKPDFIYLNSLFSKHFTLLPLMAFKNRPEKVVLAPRGMLGVESLKIKAGKKKIFLALSRLLNLYKGIRWHVTNELEANLVKQHFGSNSNTHVSANLPFITKDFEYLNKSADDALRILTVGRIVPIKNILLVLEALKDIKSPVVFTLVGPMEDMDYWNTCEELIEQLPDHVLVDYIGERIPEDLDQYYKANHVYVSGTLNENYGHSIVEAFGYACPVVITDKTPWRDLKAKGVGFDCSLSAAEFTKSIQFFADMDTTEFKQYQERCRKFAETELLNQDSLDRAIHLFK